MSQEGASVLIPYLIVGNGVRVEGGETSDAR